MADIIVSKVNEVFIKVVAEDHIIAELNDYFTFFSPDYKWSPRFKKHQWDGKIRLFNVRTYQLYAGLLRYVMTFATDRKYSIEFEAHMGMMNNFSVEEAKEYIEKLDIWSQGKALDTRDYQIVGLAKAIRYKRMLILSPTSSGKSYMMYAISRFLLEKHCKKGLIIVPTINLVEQLKSDFEDYAHDTWDVEENVHKIYQGQDKSIDKPITISTWQSIFDMEDNRKFFAEFDFVIGDEAHGFKANSLKGIMTKMINAKYRIAMTGTLDDWKVHKLVIEGLFGPNSKLTTTRRMIDEKQSADISIKALILKHPTEICAIASKWKRDAYRREIDYIIGNMSRNKFIRNLALSLKGNTLLLFQFIEKHGDLLYKLINEGAAQGRSVYFVHGLTEAEEREEVRRLVEKETDAIIIASYGVYSTGINIRNLHNIIFASPSKSKIRVLQSIGRGLRLGDNKTHMTLYDISDDLRINDFVNHTLKHFSERVKIYRSEEFKVSNYNIELK
jgi:superfamily II DNA or RNA helicase